MGWRWFAYCLGALALTACGPRYDADRLGKELCLTLPRQVKAIYSNSEAAFTDYSNTWVLHLQATDERNALWDAIQANRCSFPGQATPCGCWEQHEGSLSFRPSESNASDLLVVQASYFPSDGLLVLMEVDW